MSKPMAPSVQLAIKPKNARSKRVLKNRESKLKENAKTAIFVRGSHTSETIKTALSELMQLKKPEGINFSKPNPVHPFDDATSLAFWSKKNDASLFAVGMHSKKRPNNLVFARTYNNEVMDMIELGVEMAKSVKESKASARYAPTQKPLFHFAGELFETHSVYQQFKNIILDFYHGEEVDKINLAGLEHVISCTIGAQDDEEAVNGVASAQPVTSLTEPSASTSLNAALPLIHFRTYSIKLLNSGSRTPLIELEHAGPSFDFRVRRIKAADPDQWKSATRKAKKKSTAPELMAGKKRKDRNVDIDEMGDKVGRLHMNKQDLSKLQTRKMKGLKKSRDAPGAEEGSGGEGEELDAAFEIPSKRVRV